MEAFYGKTGVLPASMPIHFENSLTRKKEAFIPLIPNRVGIYACGPTVYWFAHIGNLRSFIFSDILRRTLQYNGFEVTFIMNITDVGHLTGDADEGEDKMLVAMRREGKTAYDIAAFYTQAFFADITKVHILPATNYPRATEHIAEQIAMIEQLEKNGFTYTTSDGVYFDTEKLPDYGKLSGQKAEEKLAGARIDLGEKRSLTDFALWKFAHDVKREMIWDSPWGAGFPGWHLECSAMSAKYLGVPFDIHTGGIDHIPVHHENELAQTKGATGELEARYWLHNDFLTVDGGKMSKSLGNLYTLADLEEKGFHPLSYRYLCLQAHYRSSLNFSFEALEGAQNALYKLWDLARELPVGDGACEEFEARFLNAMNDDLNTPQALAVMFEMLDSTCAESTKSASLARFDAVLGLGIADFIAQPIIATPQVQVLLEKRASARENKDFTESDKLREEIAQLGFDVKDTASGQVLRERRASVIK